MRKLVALAIPLFLAGAASAQTVAAVPAEVACDMHMASTRNFVTSQTGIWGVNKTETAKRLTLRYLREEGQHALFGRLDLAKYLPGRKFDVRYHKVEGTSGTEGQKFPASNDCYFEFLLTEINLQPAGWHTPALGLRAELRYFRGGELIFSKSENKGANYAFKITSESDDAAWRSEIEFGFEKTLGDLLDKFAGQMKKKRVQ
jgi:hypothetical protein